MTTSTECAIRPTRIDYSYVRIGLVFLSISIYIYIFKGQMPEIKQQQNLHPIISNSTARPGDSRV